MTRPRLTSTQERALLTGYKPGLAYHKAGDWRPVRSLSIGFSSSTIFRLHGLGLVLDPGIRRPHGTALELTPAGIAEAERLLDEGKP